MSIKVFHYVLYFHMISFQVGIFQFIPGFDFQNCVDLKYLVSFICFMILAIDSVDLFDYVPW